MSRGRLTNQLYHGPNATDDDGLHHHDHLEEDVPDLTSQLRRSRAEPPVSPELIDIADAWQELTAAIDAIDIPRQQALLANRDQLEQTRRLLTNDLERLNRQLERETDAFPWPKRRRLVNDLHAERERTVTQLQDVIGQLAHIDAAMAREGLPDRRQLGTLLQRRVQLDTELRGAADIRIRAQRTAPPDYLTDLLGPRPAASRTGDRWDQTATRIEHHRLRWRITDRNDPLGEHLPNPPTRQHAAALRDELRRATNELRRDAPVRSIGAIHR
jgi:hypothetical protein